MQLNTLKKKLEDIPDYLSKEDLFDLWISTCKAVSRKELPKSEWYKLREVCRKHQNYMNYRLLEDAVIREELLLKAYMEESKAKYSLFYRLCKSIELGHNHTQEQIDRSKRISKWIENNILSDFEMNKDEIYVADEQYINEVYKELGIQ